MEEEENDKCENLCGSQSLKRVYNLSDTYEYFIERMVLELWTGDRFIIETRAVSFTWIQTTQQPTTIEAPTSEM